MKKVTVKSATQPDEKKLRTLTAKELEAVAGGSDDPTVTDPTDDAGTVIHYPPT